MHLFYTPDIFSLDTYTFSKEESMHAIKVLRLTLQDKVQLFDGKGNTYLAQIFVNNPKECRVTILSHEYTPQKTPLLHIAIAPTKNMDRLEWFIEKSTEIGIHDITSLIGKHSERKETKIERLEKVMIAAAKQSQQTYTPIIHKDISFKEFIQQDFDGNKYMAYCNEPAPHLKEVLPPRTNALILIGPEGDFSKEEIHLAKDNGYTLVSLGNNRLRTETAGVYACTLFNILNA